ncbi:SAM-dependent methyltransferase [Parabacteroides sp. ZJ-118]|uniref:THUMP-like domain-containing protein n=1 Tax=Parabacteroides sp. ZJ-118 TaxID=2709398 RepID=UPI0013EA23CF|nr:SAM-dependent methyltransferase [Parabacteroides sp. ZJ-118]
MKGLECLLRFVDEHKGDDPDRLLLSAKRYPEVDMPLAVDQILARRKVKDKLPTWWANKDVFFPSRISAEQCSGELAATYKQTLVSEGIRMCDLTGGLGVDSYFFSRKVDSLVYLERFASYCDAARHNFKALGADNIEVVNGDSLSALEGKGPFDLFCIDPARRGEGNKRIFALRDCEPDLTALMPDLLEHAPRVIAKISPMADIRQTSALLPWTTEVHVVSVRNECKELLFLMDNERMEDRVNLPITCVNLGSDQAAFKFTLAEEERFPSRVSGDIRAYLYEPNASILKAGAFKAVASCFGLSKLHVSSHLYTSDKLVPDFPGRSFRVEEVIPFTNKRCKTLSRQISQANITVRNFPLSVDELRKQTKIADGGITYLFATTLENGDKILVKTHKI